eukprot:9162607-Alexandrium_andersonii.AAC.1
MQTSKAAEVVEGMDAGDSNAPGDVGAEDSDAWTDAVRMLETDPKLYAKLSSFIKENPCEMPVQT